jgi:uncharacterized protein
MQESLVMEEVFGVKWPVFGMIHLAPLPGSPRYKGSMDAVLERAKRDAEALSKAGVNALVVENFNDDPFYKTTQEPETVAAMTLASHLVSERTGLPLGLNVLRNAWKAAMGISATVGARFIRLNVLTDALLSDQGVIEGQAADLLRYRQMIGAQEVLIFADIESKHGVPLVPRPRSVVAQDMVERGGADAIIVSGASSSDPVNIAHLEELRQAVPGTPLIIGSGMSLETVEFLRYADATIFGFGAKPHLKAPVDAKMAMKFMDAVRELRNQRK